MKTGAAWQERTSPSRLNLERSSIRGNRNQSSSPTVIASPGAHLSPDVNRSIPQLSCIDDQQGVDANTSNQSRRSSPATVLLVSEDDYFRTTMRAYLEHVGCRVRCCSHIAWLPNLFFQKAGADLLLLDLDLLGMRVAREMTAFAPGLPVIAIAQPSTAMRDFADANQLGWGLLRKPVVLPELLGMIRKMLETDAIAGCSAAPVAPPGEAGPQAPPSARMDARGRMAPQEAKISCQAMEATGMHQ